MKKTFLLCFLLIIKVAIFAEIIAPPFNTDSFSINLTPSKNLHKIDVNEEIYQHYNFAFKDADGKYEIRVTSFSIDDGYSGPITEQAFYSYTMVISYNIAGSPENIRKQIPFDPGSIKEDFNAEAGYAVFILDEQGESNYLSGNKYAIINYFINSKYGIICQVIMFQSTDVMDDPDYLTDFNTLASFKNKN